MLCRDSKLHRFKLIVEPDLSDASLHVIIISELILHDFVYVSFQKATGFARIPLSPAGLTKNMNGEYTWDQRPLVLPTSSRTAVLQPRCHYTMGMGATIPCAQHPVDLYFWI